MRHNNARTISIAPLASTHQGIDWHADMDRAMSPWIRISEWVLTGSWLYRLGTSFQIFPMWGHDTAECPARSACSLSASLFLPGQGNWTEKHTQKHTHTHTRTHTHTTARVRNNEKKREKETATVSDWMENVSACWQLTIWHSRSVDIHSIFRNSFERLDPAIGFPCGRKTPVVRKTNQQTNKQKLLIVDTKPGAIPRKHEY